MRQILVIDDDDVDRGFIEKALERFPSGATVTSVTTFEEAVECAKKVLFDIIILDANLRGSVQIDTPNRIRSLNPKSSAIIILTGYRNEGVVLESMNAGASRYMEKSVLAKPDEFRAQVATTFYGFRAKREKEFSLGGLDAKISNEELARIVCENGAESAAGRIEIKNEIAEVAKIANAAKTSSETTETLFRELNGKVQKTVKEIAALKQTNWDRFIQFSTAHIQALSPKAWGTLAGVMFVVAEAALQARDGLRAIIALIFHFHF